MATRQRLRSPKLMFDVDLLKAMADETRLRILQHLCTPGAGEMLGYSVTDLAETFALTASTVSHHLQTLKRADLVTVRRVGKERRYSLKFETLRRNVGQFNDVLGLIESAMERAARASDEA